MSLPARTGTHAMRVIAVLTGLLAAAIHAQTPQNVDAFRQIDNLVASPNSYRSASGAPGPSYWQQRADYVMSVQLNENARHIRAKAQITYHNNSPDALHYLWVQLDQNRFRADSLSQRSASVASDNLSFAQIRALQAVFEGDHGYTIEAVTNGDGSRIGHLVVDTMLRIDLPEPLQSGQSFVFNIAWSFNIVQRDAVRSRGGYEHFPESDTLTFFLAQWFPRMAAYTDYGGWQHHAYLGRGEFALEFGDYDVRLTVPADHVVAATGELQNPLEALTESQAQRLAEARQSDTPVFVVTPEEARTNEASPEANTRTWHFKAQNVRDFAWASSRKFIWDAMLYRQGGEVMPEVLVMSFYPNEAEPLWSQYSSHAVAHALEVYSRFTFDYPYPTAQSVNTWSSGGMEYPMITFNGYRPTPAEKDSITSEEESSEPPGPTYSRSTKRRLISVIVHEIGHMYFPMIVNSDEREWAWMDEGLNSFLTRLTNLEWEEAFYARQGSQSILDGVRAYMVSNSQVPIMTSPDSIARIGPNAYGKVTAALTLLRETVLGREVFDHAFRTYAKQWKFKRPTPGDFFRSMEDAAGMDLDWFWRGWFFSTDNVDIAITDVRETQISSMDPDIEYPLKEALDSSRWPVPIDEARNRATGAATRIERFQELEDFYNEYGPYTVTDKDRNQYKDFLQSLETWEQQVLDKATKDEQWLYFVDFANLGGLVSPLPLRLTYADGNTEALMIPAEIWRYNSETATRLLVLDRQLKSIELDPLHQTADTDRSNNRFAGASLSSRIELERGDDDGRDLMADMRVKLETDEQETE